jgi:hypothetical protein
MHGEVTTDKFEPQCVRFITNSHMPAERAVLTGPLDHVKLQAQPILALTFCAFRFINAMPS